MDRRQRPPARYSGRAFSRAIVPSISAGQMKRMVRSGLRERAAADQPLERRARLRGCPRSRVALSLAPGDGMVEVAGEDDLLVAPPPGDDRGRDQIGARAPAGVDLGPQPHRLAAAQPLLPAARAGRRDHEGEGRVRRRRSSRWPQRTRLSSSPHQAVRWFCAQEMMPAAPKRPTASAGDRARLRGGQNEPAAHLLALIVALARSRRRYRPARPRRARETLSCARLIGCSAQEAIRCGSPLPKLGEARVPARPRALGAVEDLAVRGQRDDLHALQAIIAQPVADQPRRRRDSPPSRACDGAATITRTVRSAAAPDTSAPIASPCAAGSKGGAAPAGGGAASRGAESARQQGSDRSSALPRIALAPIPREAAEEAVVVPARPRVGVGDPEARARAMKSCRRISSSRNTVCEDRRSGCDSGRRRQARSVSASGVPAAKPNLKASAGIPASMKEYWSERTKQLRSGKGSGTSGKPHGGADRAGVRAEAAFLGAEHGDARQREERKRHVVIEIGDDRAARHGRRPSEPARAEQALLLAGQRDEQHRAARPRPAAAAIRRRCRSAPRRRRHCRARRCRSGRR